MIIQHLKNIYSKIYIHPWTLFYLGLSIWSGYAKWYLSALMIVCIHETCHLSMACFLHFKVNKIKILPFGAYLDLDDYDMHSIIEELCVVIAGPCSHLLVYFLITMMNQSVYQAYLLKTNQLIFFFNLLPIYPLDGGRGVLLILERFLDLKKSMYLGIKFSILSLCLFIACFLKVNTLIVIVYLCYYQVEFFCNIPQKLRLYYSRIDVSNDAKKISVHKCLEYRRGYYNYYLINGKLFDEKDMINDLINSVKKI